ncbi:MAG: nitrogenase iron-molybdenum cofactor biosynthesis protein NifN [Nitrosomonadales bacterium]|nr:nitrogenase iron-molybdenum cofactor biosynthesis protein NifN [Nitrosomonadales bacterium]
MAIVSTSKKACTVNPLKMSQPMGGALAFMGLANCMPVLHGSQGCTAFGLVLFVRHFREAIPLQTTAMNEVTTIMGGMDNIEQALLNINKRAQPEIIGLCTTGLTETRSEDIHGDLKLIRQRHPELAKLPIVFVDTPDFKDAFQDGWSKTVARIIEELATKTTEAIPGQVNLLPGSHLTAADIEEIMEMIEAFGLTAVVLPDLSGSLDGHIPEQFTPTTLGGTTVDEVRSMGSSLATLAIGQQMERAALELEMRTGVSYTVFDRLTGLDANDRFLMTLSGLSGRPVPLKYRRQRSQLVDAMLDGHFYFGGKKVAIGAEPDLLWSLGTLMSELGCEIAAAVTTTYSPQLEKMPCAEVLIGDLEDLELRAKDCDLLVTHSHGRQASERLGIPLFRAGLPCFDRLGANHRLSVGYRGTRDLIFQIGNVFLEHSHENAPDSWPLPEANDEPATQAQTV